MAIDNLLHIFFRASESSTDSDSESESEGASKQDEGVDVRVKDRKHRKEPSSKAGTALVYITCN